MNTLTQDITTALKAMIKATMDFFYESGQFLLFISVGGGICWGFGYCFINWPVYSIGAILVLMLMGWFLAELHTAQFIREMEEKEKQNGKN
jgi:hypothetical protein